MFHPEHRSDALQQVAAHSRGNVPFFSGLRQKDDFVLSPLELQTDSDLQKNRSVSPGQQSKQHVSTVSADLPPKKHTSTRYEALVFLMLKYLNVS